MEKWTFLSLLATLMILSISRKTSLHVYIRLSMFTIIEWFTLWSMPDADKDHSNVKWHALIFSLFLDLFLFTPQLNFFHSTTINQVTTTKLLISWSITRSIIVVISPLTFSIVPTLKLLQIHSRWSNRYPSLQFRFFFNDTSTNSGESWNITFHFISSLILSLFHECVHFDVYFIVLRLTFFICSL